VAEIAWHSSGMGRLPGALLALVLLGGLLGCGDADGPTAGTAGRLSVHPVLGTAAEETVTDPDELDPLAKASVRDPDGGAALAIGPAVLTREHVAAAAAEPGRPGGPADAVTVEWTDGGAVRWARLTGRAACAPPGDPARRIAVLLDGAVLTAPSVSPAVQCDVGVEGGSTQLLGPFGSLDAAQVAAALQPEAGQPESGQPESGQPESGQPSPG
jgi:SecD/SecF fusion protein